MPSGPRIRANNVFGVTTDNPLTGGATSFNSVSLFLLPAVSSAHAVVVLDPKRVNGEPEIVVVTAHTALATSATITRGAYGTIARSHPVGTQWAHVVVTDDMIPVVTSSTRPSDPYEGQLIYETNLDGFRFNDGSSWLGLIPSGLVSPFAGSSAPVGWLLCNGSAVSRTGFADLFTAIGTTYGVGDGSTTFNLPNFLGRVPVGRDAGQIEFDILGETGGAKTHTLTTGEIPSHNHLQDPHSHNFNSAATPAGNQGNSLISNAANPPVLAGGAVLPTTATNQPAGGGGSHNNLQPYLVINYVIKV